jgi:Domain of unknown function (DUF4160)
MPTIASVGGTAIVMYYNDHAPPHFHAKQGGLEFRVRITDLKLMRGDAVPNALEHMVRNWAVQHQQELAVCWARVQSGQPPGRISGP